MRVLAVVADIFMLFAVLFVFAGAKVSSQADEQAERLWRKKYGER